MATERKYDAFLSYAREDELLAAEVQRALQSLARPWYLRRRLRIFRDDGELKPSGDLWGTIELALGRSKSLLVLCTPSSAASRNVSREISAWLDRESVDQVVMIVGGGDLIWSGQFFDSERSSALPQALRCAFTIEPLYVDLRSALGRERAQDGHALRKQLRANSRFRKAMVQVCAALLDKTPDEVESDELRAYRGRLRTALAAATLIALLGVAAAVLGFRSAANARNAANIAEQMRVDAVAVQAGNLDGQTAALLLATLPETPEPREGVVAARAALSQAQFPTWSWREVGPIQDACFTPDGSRILSASLDGNLRLLDLGAATKGPVLSNARWATHVEFDGRGDRALAAYPDGTVRIWETRRPGEPVVLKHDEWVESAVFSLDGGRVLTASRDGTARLWNADGTGKPLILHAEGWVTSAEFSPDGSLILTAAEGGAWLWDLDGRKQAVGFAHEAHVEVVTAHFSVDGTRVLTGARDGTVRLWNAATGEQLAMFSEEVPVTMAELDTTGKLVLAVFADGTVRLYDLEAQRQRWAMVKGGIETVHFDSTGRRFVTSSQDGTARVRESARANTLAILRHRTEVQFAKFDPTDKRVLTGTLDGSLNVWELTRTDETTLLDQQQELQGARFSGNGTRVLAFTDTRLHLKTMDPQTPGLTIDQPSLLTDAVLSPDSSAIVTGSADGNIRVWDPVKGELRRTLLHGTKQLVEIGGLNADASRLLSVSRERAVLWGSEAKERAAFRCPTADDSIVTARLSEDGQRVLLSCAGGLIRVIDAGAGAELWRTQEPARAVAFTKNGLGIAAASEDGGRLWLNLEAPPIFVPHLGAILVAVDAAGEQVATGSRDGSVVVWQSRSPQERALFHHDEAVGPEFLERGGLIASSSRLQLVAEMNKRLSDVLGQPVTQAGHPSVVESLEFSPDGTSILAASGVGSAFLWDIGRRRAPVELAHREGTVRSAHFSPAGNQVVTAGADGVAKVWNVAWPDLRRTLIATTARFCLHRELRAHYLGEPSGKAADAQRACEAARPDLPRPSVSPRPADELESAALALTPADQSRFSSLREVDPKNRSERLAAIVQQAHDYTSADEVFAVGRVLAAVGEWANAATVLRRARTLYGSSPAATRVDAEFARLASDDDEPEAGTDQRSALKQHLAEGRPREAAEDWLALGARALAKKQFEEADLAYRAALALASRYGLWPTLADAHRGLGGLCGHRDLRVQAETHLLHGIRIDTRLGRLHDVARGYTMLGWIFSGRDEAKAGSFFAEAMTAARIAAKSSSSSAVRRALVEALFGMAYTLEDTDSQRAAALYYEVLQKSFSVEPELPTRARAFTGLARLHTKAGDFDQAESLALESAAIFGALHDPLQQQALRLREYIRAKRDGKIEPDSGLRFGLSDHDLEAVVGTEF